MNFLLHALYGIIVSPARTFTFLAHTHSFGLSVVMLIVLCVLFGASVFSTEKIRYRISPSHASPRSSDIFNFFMCALLFPGAWFWMALLTRSLLGLFHVAADFETLFSLLVYAALPQFLGWFTFPIRNLHRNCYHAWQVGMTAFLLWTTGLVLLAINRGYGIEGWRLLVAGFPLPTLLWVAGISAGVDQPETLSAACRWQKTRGEHVIVFAPPNVSQAETAEIARGCDDTLLRAARLLEVELPAFKVGVFLFANAEEHKRVSKIKRELMGGYAHSDCITLRYGKWDHLHGIVPHEFTHVLRDQRITRTPAAILDEGMAEYVNETLFANTAHTPGAALPHSLRVLANNQIFYSWLYAEQPDYPAHHYYSHAHGFARFMIQRKDISAFKQVMRETAQDTSEDVGERLANAISKVYGVALPELETEWRNTYRSNE